MVPGSGECSFNSATASSADAGPKEDSSGKLEKLGAMQFVVDDEAARTAFGKTSDLAEKYGLTVYDAHYLEVALRRKLPLASRDDALQQAAKRCGVKVL